MYAGSVSRSQPSPVHVSGGNSITQVLRPGERVLRHGGDEFDHDAGGHHEREPAGAEDVQQRAQGDEHDAEQEEQKSLELDQACIGEVMHCGRHLRPHEAGFN